MSERDELGTRLDHLRSDLAWLCLCSAGEVRHRGAWRRRCATAAALSCALGLVAVFGLGTFEALRPHSLAGPANHAPVIAPRPAAPTGSPPPASHPAPTVPSPASTPAATPGGTPLLVLPDALLPLEQWPDHPDGSWVSRPLQSGADFWANSRHDDHQHCWRQPLPRTVQEAARHFSVHNDPLHTEADEVVAVAATPADAAGALALARSRCTVGASTPTFNPSPSSPPVNQFSRLYGENGFTYTRDATSLGSDRDRPNCEYAVMLQRGNLLLLVVVTQLTFSYDLPRADAEAATLAAMSWAEAHLTRS